MRGVFFKKEIGAGFEECRGYSTVSVQNRQSSFSLSFLPSSSCIIVGHVAFEPPSFFFLVIFFFSKKWEKFLLKKKT